MAQRPTMNLKKRSSVRPTSWMRRSTNQLGDISMDDLYRFQQTRSRLQGKHVPKGFAACVRVVSIDVKGRRCGVRRFRREEPGDRQAFAV